MSVTSSDDIARALRELGLAGRSIAVHASLKSFGEVQGGAGSVVQALTSVAKNVLMPAFNWGEGSALVAPPDGQWLEHNGLDEAFRESLPAHPRPFDPASSDVLAEMGAVPRALRATEGTIRSHHPLASWLAFGPEAAELVLEQPWSDPFFPLRRLSERDGVVLLAGVGLRACTTLHLAEERAGRRAFVRWALAADGSARKAVVGGCSDGFDRLWPRLGALFAIARAGDAELRAVPIQELVTHGGELLKECPELSVCDRRCIRCLDAVRGGPRAPVG